jgi:roadblock/LC7 domain-containing protein
MTYSLLKFFIPLTLLADLMGGRASAALDICPMSWTPRADWINVKNPSAISAFAGYKGAMGDGVADDTVAIQAIFKYIENNNNGAYLTVYFPTGWDFPLLLLAQKIDPASLGGDATNASEPLRGYYKMTISNTKTGTVGWGPWENDSRLFEFNSTSAENALTVTGKYLADLNLSPDVADGRLDIDGKSFREVNVSGGAIYAGYAIGNNGSFISMAKDDTFKAYLGALPLSRGEVFCASDLTFFSAWVIPISIADS